MSDTPDYKIVQQLGAGIAGTVYLAETLDRRVCIRQFHSHAQAGTVEAANEREHFLRAAGEAKGLHDPHIVAVLDILDEDDAYVVTEYTPHETFRDALSQSSLGIEQANHLLRLTALALDYAHKNGVLHGDLKPSNVFLMPGREVKVSDFAISPRADRRRAAIPQEWNHAYLPPEYFADREAIGPRSDQYSLAAIAYQIHTGQLPYRSNNTGTAGWRLEPASLLNSRVPAAADAVLARGLAANPRDRFISCLQFVHFLEESFAPARLASNIVPPPSKTRAFWLMASVLAFILIAALIVFGLHRSGAQSNPSIAGPVTAKPSETEKSKPPSPKPQLAETKIKPKQPDAPAPPMKHSGLGAVVDVTPNTPAAQPQRKRKSEEAAGRITENAETARIEIPAPETALSLEVYSRDKTIEPGISFAQNDPELGQLAIGDLKAKVTGVPSRSRLVLKWFVDGVPFETKTVSPNQLVEFENEPVSGSYRVVLLSRNARPLSTFTFRITKSK